MTVKVPRISAPVQIEITEVSREQVEQEHIPFVKAETFREWSKEIDPFVNRGIALRLIGSIYFPLNLGFWVFWWGWWLSARYYATGAGSSWGVFTIIACVVSIVVSVLILTLTKRNTAKVQAITDEYLHPYLTTDGLDDGETAPS